MFLWNSLVYGAWRSGLEAPSAAEAAKIEHSTATCSGAATMAAAMDRRVS
jgi:hypothetical protein